MVLDACNIVDGRDVYDTLGQFFNPECVKLAGINHELELERGH